jgi:hypothetical protein
MMTVALLGLTSQIINCGLSQPKGVAQAFGGLLGCLKAVLLTTKGIANLGESRLGALLPRDNGAEVGSMALGGIVHGLAVPALGLGFDAEKGLGARVPDGTNLSQGPLLDDTLVVSGGLLEESHLAH